MDEFHLSPVALVFVALTVTRDGWFLHFVVWSRIEAVI